MAAHRLHFLRGRPEVHHQLARGDHTLARQYLERFFEAYSHADGWTRSARTMLGEIGPEIAGA